MLSMSPSSTTSQKTSSARQRITLFLSPALVKLAKAQAVVEDITFTALVETSLSSYLPTEVVIKKPE